MAAIKSTNFKKHDLQAIWLEICDMYKNKKMFGISTATFPILTCYQKNTPFVRKSKMAAKKCRLKNNCYRISLSISQNIVVR